MDAVEYVDVLLVYKNKTKIKTRLAIPLPASIIVPLHKGTTELNYLFCVIVNKMVTVAVYKEG